MSNKIIIFCTVASLEEANTIAKTLLNEHLAACVNVLQPVHSIYRWQGQVEEAEEILLMIKSRTENWEALREKVLQLHSYDVPELIAVPVTVGNPSYLQWIDDSTNAV